MAASRRARLLVAGLVAALPLAAACQTLIGLDKYERVDGGQDAGADELLTSEAGGPDVTLPDVFSAPITWASTRMPNPRFDSGASDAQFNTLDAYDLVGDTVSRPHLQARLVHGRVAPPRLRRREGVLRVAHHRREEGPAAHPHRARLPHRFLQEREPDRAPRRLRRRPDAAHVDQLARAPLRGHDPVLGRRLRRQDGRPLGAGKRLCGPLHAR